MNILDRFKYAGNPKNYPGWESAEYIGLIDQAMKLPCQKERALHLEKAEKLLIEEMPIAPLYHWNFIYMQQKNVSGIHMSSIGSIHFEKTRLGKTVSISK